MKWGPRGVATAILAVLTLILCLHRNGAERPLEGHEAFVARTATEMGRGGDYLVPRFNGEVRLQKPPLAYWLVMGAHQAWGGTPVNAVAERGARLPGAVAAALLVVTALLAGRVWTGRDRGGMAAGLLMMGAAGLFTWGRSARPEMVYSLLSGMGMTAFLGAEKAQDRGSSTLLWALLGWGCLGMACLSKGPHLPGLLLVGWGLGTVWARGVKEGVGRVMGTLHPLLGVGVAAAVSLPWYLMVMSRVPDALSFWNEEFFHRLQPTDPGEGRPWPLAWLWHLPAVLGPGAVLLPAVLALPWIRPRGERERILPLWGAVMVPALLASLLPPIAQRSYYLLPCLLPLVLLTVEAGRPLWEEPQEGEGDPAWEMGLNLATWGFSAGFAFLALVIAARWIPEGRFTTEVAFWLGSASLLAAWLPGLVPRIHRAGWLALAVWMAWMGVAASSGSRVERRIEAARFGKDVGALAPKGRELVVVDGLVAAIVHYADHKVVQVSEEELGKRLSSPEPPLVLARSSWVERGVLGGVELAREEGGADPLVLVEGAKLLETLGMVGPARVLGGDPRRIQEGYLIPPGEEEGVRTTTPSIRGKEGTSSGGQ